MHELDEQSQFIWPPLTSVCTHDGRTHAPEHFDTAAGGAHFHLGGQQRRLGLGRAVEAEQLLRLAVGARGTLRA